VVVVNTSGVAPLEQEAMTIASKRLTIQVVVRRPIINSPRARCDRSPKRSQKA
jgi:hypothetical protein